MSKDEGCKLMGAAFEVYNQLGYGMAEEINQQSLEIELLSSSTTCGLLERVLATY